eukprot:920289-Rhodomonas_salina.3
MAAVASVYGCSYLHLWLHLPPFVAALVSIYRSAPPPITAALASNYGCTSLHVQTACAGLHFFAKLLNVFRNKPPTRM